MQSQGHIRKGVQEAQAEHCGESREPGQQAVATIQVKGAKDLPGGSWDREKRADGDILQKWS